MPIVAISLTPAEMKGVPMVLRSDKHPAGRDGRADATASGHVAVSSIEGLRGIMRRWPKPRMAGGRLVITTQCLYPSNAFVSVSVEGGTHHFTASDGGGAVNELQSTGLELPHARFDNVIRSITRPQGLWVEGGVIVSPVVEINALPGTVALVANASKDAAALLLGHFSAKMHRNIHAELARILDKRYPGRVLKDVRLQGASSKEHRFDYVLRLPDEHRLVIDTVINDVASINAKVVANLDVGQAKYEDIIQRIVYDELEPWSAANLQLLQIGATAIPFGRVGEVIERLAA